ncbi:phage head closure protein [Escherichia coli]|nr:phage head closure protein [Escherichia coli]
MTPASVQLRASWRRLLLVVEKLTHEQFNNTLPSLATDCASCMPADNFGVEPQYPVTFRTWAKVIQTSATTWQETAQTGDAITHYITIRYRRGITADYEVVCGDSVYRVKRQRDLNGARRFLLLECTELGECRQSHGGNNDDFLFAR